MSASADVIGAFSEANAERLTGVTQRQLRHWDRIGLLTPSLSGEERGFPFSRMYAFKDLVSLRVLNKLRNVEGVSLQHLREVSAKLAHLGEHRWTGMILYVGPNKRVIWHEPGTDQPQEIVSRQYVLKLPLAVEIEDTRAAIVELNRRGPDKVGRVERHRFVQRNEPVFAGTRIPIAAVRRFAAAGYSPADIVGEYPDLTEADVRTAIGEKSQAAVA